MNLSIQQRRPDEDASPGSITKRLAFDNLFNLPSACLGSTQLHVTSFWLQEGFLHSNAGFRSPEHLLPVWVQTRAVGTGTMPGTKHLSSDLCCHLTDECKNARCLRAQGCLCIAASVVETLSMQMYRYL